MRKIACSLSLAGLLCGAIAAPQMAMAQVYRCTVNGQPTYQQAPCETAGGTGVQVRIKAPPLSSGTPPARPASVAAAPPAASAASAPAAPPTAPPRAPVKSDLERYADACLDWYRPRLRDPAGAYHRGAALDRGVLTLTLYATNGFGGYVDKRAACEVKDGKIDDGWTKIHAKRLGWIGF